MDPKVFGRGSWFFIFYLIYYFLEKQYKEIDLYFKIKDFGIINLTFEQKRKYENFIKNINNENFIDEIKLDNLEKLKQKISIIISSLPCNECKQHSINNLNNNNVYNCNSICYILHFFIELRNNFYNNKINRNLLNNINNIIKHKELIFNQILLE